MPIEEDGERFVRSHRIFALLRDHQQVQEDLWLAVPTHRYLRAVVSEAPLVVYPSYTRTTSDMHSRRVNRDTNPEELPKHRVIRFTWSPLDIFLRNSQHSLEPFHVPLTRSFVNQNLNTSSIRPVLSSELPILKSMSAVCDKRRGANAALPGECLRSVEILPIFYYTHG